MIMFCSSLHGIEITDVKPLSEHRKGFTHNGQEQYDDGENTHTERCQSRFLPIV